MISSGGARGPALALALVVAWNVAPRLWPALARPAYFDESFAMTNARIAAEGGWPRMDNAFYLATCYFPVALIWKALDGAGVDVARNRYNNSTALRAARMWSVLHALASLVVIAHLGRKVSGNPWVGVAAAMVLAAFPRHVRSGHQIKPDMLVMFWTLAAASAAVAAAHRASLAAWLRSALFASLAFGSKISGFSAAFPIVAVTLASARRHPRRLLWLAAAGASASALFLALNPYPGHLRQAIGVVARDYRDRGRLERTDHLDVAVRLLDFLWQGHGPLLAVAALAGVAAWAWTAVRGRGAALAPVGGETRLVALALAVVPLGHGLIHTLSTTLFRGQNVIGIIPFTSLAAASVAAWAASAAIARWGRGARWTAIVLGGALASWLMARPWLIAQRDLAGT
jgi:4-amino-4-deoxy-L-arabinose transferase-like glycosyltransferase